MLNVLTRNQRIAQPVTKTHRMYIRNHIDEQNDWKNAELQMEDR
jgi:hypothetical protein